MGGLFAPALFMGACLGGLSGRALRDNFWPWAINLPFLGIEKVRSDVGVFRFYMILHDFTRFYIDTHTHTLQRFRNFHVHFASSCFFSKLTFFAWACFPKREYRLHLYPATVV